MTSWKAIFLTLQKRKLRITLRAKRAPLRKQNAPPPGTYLLCEQKSLSREGKSPPPPPPRKANWEKPLRALLPWAGRCDVERSLQAELPRPAPECCARRFAAPRGALAWCWGSYDQRVAGPRAKPRLLSSKWHPLVGGGCLTVQFASPVPPTDPTDPVTWAQSLQCHRPTLLQSRPLE